MAKITIETSTGKLEIDAEIIGQWGIWYDEPHSGYNLTHIRSGRYLMVFKSADIARAAARYLEAYDFDTLTAQSDPAGKMPKSVLVIVREIERIFGGLRYLAPALPVEDHRVKDYRSTRTKVSGWLNRRRAQLRHWFGVIVLRRDESEYVPF